MSNRIRPFGYDWMGRFFCLDGARVIKDEPAVLLLEPSSQNAYEIPATLIDFYDGILIENAEQALEVELFEEWRSKNERINLSMPECVGCRVPLFLGGQFCLENLELIDLKLYWNIVSQISKQAEKYPEGTSIDSVRLDH